MSYFERSGGIFLVSEPTRGVRFQLWPESIEDQKSVNWSSISVIGRSEPIPFYQGSAHQTLRFELMFAASVDEADNVGVDGVRRNVNFLKSLTYPQVFNGISTTPPLVWVIVGESIASRCVVQGVRVNTEGPWSLGEIKPNSGLVSERVISPIDLVDPQAAEANPYVNLPIIAKVELEFIVVQKNQLDSRQVMFIGDKSSDFKSMSFLNRNRDLGIRYSDQDQ